MVPTQIIQIRRQSCKMGFGLIEGSLHQVDVFGVGVGARQEGNAAFDDAVGDGGTQ